ncbi:MAG: radical SAM protein [Candidatus Omnitrophica bacterium]|nr:radical SAM protein [Candidatus Omnitrophota bacterium]
MIIPQEKKDNFSAENRSCGKVDFRDPQMCYVHLTDNCFMRCKMCKFWQTPQRVSKVPLDDWERFFSSFKEYIHEPIDISIGGGEPLTHENLFPLIKIIRGLGFRLVLNSNGYLIDTEIALKIKDAKVNSIMLSLDSLKSGTHDYLRGKTGALSSVFEAIECLDYVAPEVDISISATIMESNLEDILSLARWAQEHSSIKFINFQAVTQPFNENHNDQWYLKKTARSIWPQNIEQVYSVLDKLIELKMKKFHKICNPVSQLALYKKYFKDPQGFVERKGPCNAVDFGIFIFPAGDIALCPYKLPIGNVRQDFRELYLSTSAQERRREIASCKDVCHFLLNCNYEE